MGWFWDTPSGQHHQSCGYRTGIKYWDDEMYPSPFISDHCVFKCEIKYKRDRPIEEYIRYWKINKIDTDAFVKDLLLTKITDDLDLAMKIDVFQHELGIVLEEDAPMITKRLSIRQPKPWFSYL